MHHMPCFVQNCEFFEHLLRIDLIEHFLDSISIEIEALKFYQPNLVLFS